MKEYWGLRIENPLFLEERCQELRQFPIESAIERIRFLHGVVFVAGKVTGPFPADVHADNLVSLRKFLNKSLHMFQAEGALVPIGGGIGGGEYIFVDGDVNGCGMWDVKCVMDFVAVGRT